MRFAAPSVLLVSLAITFTCAQTNNLPKVQHVVIVIQENRTPDNLFQQDQTLINNGAHILSQGLCLTPNQTQVTVPLSSTPLGTCWDTGHGHQPDWTTMWSNGAMNGACQVSWSPANCTPHPPLCSNQSVGQYCPAMTYVQNSVWTTLPVQQRILDPYFQIANQYGWANYMFQTNQGPSFPAHQFLFSGTSAPIQYGDLGDPCNNYPCWEWFDAGNVTGNGKQDKTTGCIANLGRTAVQINPLSVESLPPNPLGFSNGYPCYDHPTMADVLASTSPQGQWKYYARSASDLWTAPTAINRICMTNGGGNGGACADTTWQS